MFGWLFLCCNNASWQYIFYCWKACSFLLKSSHTGNENGFVGWAEQLRMWATPMNSSCQTVYSPVDSPLMFFVGLDEVRTNKTSIWKNQTQSNQPFTSSSYWSHTAVGWYPQPVSQLCHTLNLWFNYHWQNLDSYYANLDCKSVKDSIAVLCAEEARKLCSCVVVFLGWVSPNTSLKLPYGTGPFRISQTCHA